MRAKRLPLQIPSFKRGPAKEFRHFLEVTPGTISSAHRARLPMTPLNISRFLAIAAILCFGICVTPGPASAATAINVCIEDGGTADCTEPQALPYPGNYSVWSANGLGLYKSGLDSDQAIYNWIISYNQNCSTPENPLLRTRGH